MKAKQLAMYALIPLIAASCIQDEALNSEAAIDACIGNDVQLVDINADSKVINIYVHKAADLSKQNLKFVYPQGATLKVDKRERGDTEKTYDFSTPPHSRNFTVTSEDGKWQPTYKVNVIPAELPTSYHFEKLIVSADTPYDIFYEFDRGTSQEISKVLQWSSGNPGYKLTGMPSTNTDYPTQQTAHGYKGKAVKLITCDTGSLGATVGMHIAAGSLFIGAFEPGSALRAPRKATKFGYQFYKRPLELRGYYKYKAGEVYTENGKPKSGIKDKCDIYAVMYEADNNSFTLDGDNVFTSDKLVMKAQIDPKDIIESEEWTAFNLPFKPVKGRNLDMKKLKEGKYKISIVLSSSADGAYFKGAIGSTLYVDEMELICDK